ncbi:MAG: hypothetical protein LLG01_15545 [Planctomycetaceae bacterium]|nr:hypothetical protein [Planctomycetaceae bacterium]
MSKANFNESRKIGVELVSRDASGNLLTWRENGYDMAVARDASGNVTTLTASGPAGSYKMTIQRDAKGNYIGQTGDYLQSAMLPEIIGGGGNVLKVTTSSSGGLEFSAGDLIFGVPTILSPSFKPSIVLTLTAAATYSQSGNTVTVSSTGHGAPNRSSSFRFFWPGSAAIPQGWYDGWKYVSADVFTFENPKSQSVSAGTAITGSAKSMYVPVASLVVPERLFSDGTLLTFEAFMSCDAAASAKIARAQVNGAIAGYFVFSGANCFGKRDLSVAFRSDRWVSAQNNDGTSSPVLHSAIFNAAGGATVELCAYSSSDSAAMMFDIVKAVLK